MRIDFQYDGVITISAPAGQVSKPPGLNISLKWDESRQDENWVCTTVGQNVELWFSNGEPIRLIGVDGFVDDVVASEVARRAVTPEIWQQGLRVIEQQLAAQYLEVDSAELKSLEPTWRELREVGRSRSVTALRQGKGEIERVFRILRSDPRQWKLYVQGMERAAGEIIERASSERESDRPGD